jgi:serine/threonine protein kinase
VSVILFFKKKCFLFLQNGDLLTAVTTMNKYSEHDVALMLSQIASALKHLHSLDIVHRDVKLENILVRTYKILDFIIISFSIDYESF